MSQAKSVVDFSQMDPIERLAFDAMAFAIPPAQMEAMRTAFQKLDTDSSGTLSIDELRSLLEQSCGGEGGGEDGGAAGGLADGHVSRVLRSLDATRAGEVSYTSIFSL